MPGTNTTGGDIDERLQADIAGQVARGTLSIQDACTRYQLSRDVLVEWVAAFRDSSLAAFDEQLRRTLTEQGVDVRALAGAEFHGDLTELTLSDLIQTLTLGRRHGVIVVSHDGRESRIWCADGEIVDAESGKLTGARAVHRLLSLEQGRVRANFTPVNRRRTLQVSTMELLLDGARRSDESQALRRKLGAGLYRLAPKALSVSDSLTAEEYAVLRHFDVPLSVPDVLAHSTLGDLETLTLLARLVAREYLLPADEESVALLPARSSLAPSRPPLVLSVANLAPRRAPSRWLVATVLGLGVLGLVSWLVPRSLVDSPARGSSLPTPSGAAAPFEPSVAAALVEPAAPAALVEPAASTDTAAAAVPAASDLPKPAPATPAHRKRAPRRSVPSLAATSERNPPSRAEAAASTSAAPRMQIIEGQAPQMQILE